MLRDGREGKRDGRLRRRSVDGDEDADRDLVGCENEGPHRLGIRRHGYMMMMLVEKENGSLVFRVES